ncbi:pilus assembly protein TadG-related protein [Cellulomonas massiliensis]|uniref:pilus assembly protein TadG-related protein n=1 Tax=Cellulomonas massiliensis TaxID=1465811 RepID=UPI0003760155|nr:pilus assembly protein TadG-related protein [Cellulomonas massiliensis]
MSAAPLRRALARAERRVGRRLDEAGDDRGAMSAFVVVLVVALLLLAGLVVDGGRAVNARALALDDAEQAARAGANQVDLAHLRQTGEVRLDRGEAERAARAFLVARGYDGGAVQVASDGNSVTVEVSDRVPTVLLSLALVDDFTVEGTATARAAVGIVDEIGGAP